MDRKEVSRILEEIGLLLELLDENPFKIKAYYNGARIMELITEDIEVLVYEGRLDEIKGIGKALQEKITELVTTGRLVYYEDLRKKIPEGLFEIMKIPGLGPKKVKLLYEQLEIKSIGELEYACLENRLMDLKGFGIKSQEKILSGIEMLKKYRGKFLFYEAMDIAVKLCEDMKNHSKVIQCHIAGSLRRKKEMTKDIDLLVSAEEKDREELMDYFTSLNKVESIINKGETKSTIRTTMGIQVDLRVVSKESYPYGLQHFTGSREHNTILRHRAKMMGLKMNEYGLYKNDGEFVSCRDEEEIYSQLKLQYIPPELREGNGEIEAAEKQAIPILLELSDIKGVLHNHSIYSDGLHRIYEMAQAAISLGYEYIGISDHSKSAFYAHGLKHEDILRQHEEIDTINKKLKSIKILKGIESDILPDGSLDYDESILGKFDYVIASIHSSFNMNNEEMTNRIIKAIENKYTRILGHPSGRLLLSREPYGVNMERILKSCAMHQVAVEINANPHRLDLDWRFCKMAKEMGVLISIEPDAHKCEGLKDVKYGIGIARKGWLEAKNTLNAMDIEKLLTWLKKTPVL